MALSPMYAAILQDLNKAVAQNQPEDVLQFCANWFNAKLEEQRIAGRLSIAQAEGMQHGISVQQRSKSLASGLGSSTGSNKDRDVYNTSPANSPLSATIPPQSTTTSVHPMKKKVSLPSLIGQGYTFGSSNNSPAMGMDGPSPYSEVAPNIRIPPMPSSRGAGAGGSSLASGGGGGAISWQKSFTSSSSGGAGGNDMHDSDEENGMNYDIPPHSKHSSSSSSSGEGRDRLGALPSGSGMTSPTHASSRDNGIPTGYNLGRRTSVSAESIDPSTLSTSQHPLPKTVIPKTPSQRARIESSIEKNLLFRNLDEEQHTDVLNAMKEVRVAKGTEVIVQGAVGDFFYVVESGDFQVWVKPNNISGTNSTLPTSPTRAGSAGPDGGVENGGTQNYKNDGSKMVANIPSGGSFGELALMYNAPRSATVVCASPSATLWALDRITFRTILMEHTSKKRRMYEQFLSEVPILVSLEAHERSKIADALEERIYEEGEDVVREGELGKNFYIIESGRAEVLKKKGDKQERVGTLSKGDYFGELALLNSAPRAATVRPVPGTGRLRVATLGEKAFTRLLGPVVEILTRRAERNYGNLPSSSQQQQQQSLVSPRGGGERGEREGERGSGPNTPTGGPRDTRESGIPVKSALKNRAGASSSNTLRERESRERLGEDRERERERRDRKKSEDIVMQD